MKLCLRCNNHFDDAVELCPEEGLQLVEVGDDPLIGSILDDRYRILCGVGQGSMGTVYKALEESTGREMAIKVLLNYRGSDNDAVKRFQREAKAVSRLNHPNIVKLFHYGTMDDGQPYIVTEFLKGITLAQMIRHEKFLTKERALPIIQQVCNAVAEAHKVKIIHRDLKPENIILEQRGVKVVDFGVAKVDSESSGISSASLTMEGKVCGSPGYMSPEQCRGLEVDTRSDIYALGIIVFETLTGRRPFVADDVMGLMFMHVNEPPPPMSAVQLEVMYPSSLEAAVKKALEKSPNDRQKTVEEFWSDIEAALHAKPKVPAAAKPASGWIPFSGSAAGSLIMDFRPPSKESGDNSEEIARFQEAQERDRIAMERRAKFQRDAKIRHLFNFTASCLVTCCLVFVAIKLVVPDSVPDIDRADDLVARGKYQEAMAMLNQVRKVPLTSQDRDALNQLYIQIGVKYAQQRKYMQAVDALQRVSQSSRRVSQAQSLIKRYRKLINNR